MLKNIFFLFSVQWTPGVRMFKVLCAFMSDFMLVVELCTLKSFVDYKKPPKSSTSPYYLFIGFLITSVGVVAYCPTFSSLLITLVSLVISYM
jgi:hypothetical protein